METQFIDLLDAPFSRRGSYFAFANDNLKAENIRAVADLADYKDSLGTYMPQVKIYVDSSVDVGAIGSYTITVVIKEQPLGGNQ